VPLLALVNDRASLAPLHDLLTEQVDESADGFIVVEDRQPGQKDLAAIAEESRAHGRNLFEIHGCVIEMGHGDQGRQPAFGRALPQRSHL
jgi:hypothetical protein